MYVHYEMNRAEGRGGDVPIPLFEDIILFIFFYYYHHINRSHCSIIEVSLLYIIVFDIDKR